MSDSILIPIDLHSRTTPGSQAAQGEDGIWRLAIPAGRAGRYRWAQLDDYLHREELKRLCKTQTLFRVPGQSYLDGEYLALSVRFLPEVKRHLIAEYGDKVEILNESL